MSRGPWKEHKFHCPACAHYAQQVGKRPDGRKRCVCLNDDCRNRFYLLPGETVAAPSAPPPEPKGPYATAGRIEIGRGLHWYAGIV